MKRFVFGFVAVVSYAYGSNAQVIINSGSDAARAAIIGASLEQGRQWAEDQRISRDRAILAGQQAVIAQQAAAEARQAANAAAWANMSAAARQRSLQATVNAKAKQNRRSETIKRIQAKRKAGK
jgi:hypothetical protein